MKKLIRELPLANGLTVRFFDATRRYFGDYHQVRVTISCEVPVSVELFDDLPSHRAAVALLGASVQYRKEIEQQGVAGLLTAETVEKVIQHFVEHSLGYFQSEAFPRKLVQSELNRIKAKAKAFVPLRANG